MLEQLYRDFLQMPSNEQAAFARAYRERRTNEIEANKMRRRESSGSVITKLMLSDEEKALMKRLGLTMSAIKSIRSDDEASTSEDEEETAELFGA